MNTSLFRILIFSLTSAAAVVLFSYSLRIRAGNKNQSHAFEHAQVDLKKIQASLTAISENRSNLMATRSGLEKNFTRYSTLQKKINDRSMALSQTSTGEEGNTALEKLPLGRSVLKDMVKKQLFDGADSGIETKYGTLVSDLQLAPEVEKQLFDYLKAHSKTEMDLAWNFMSEGTKMELADFETLVANQQNLEAAKNKEIANLLGPENFRKFEEFEGNILAKHQRTSLERFFLKEGSPLTEEASKLAFNLFTTLKQDQPQAQDLYDLYRKNDPSRMMKINQNYWSRVTESFVAFLPPDQREIFQHYVERKFVEEEEMHKSALKMLQVLK